MAPADFESFSEKRWNQSLRFWFYRYGAVWKVDKTHFLGLMLQWQNVLLANQMEGIRQLEREITDWLDQDGDKLELLVTSQVIHSFGRLALVEQITIAQARLILLGHAVQTYASREGHLPASLAEAIPPSDFWLLENPLKGESFSYLITEEGVVLEVREKDPLFPPRKFDLFIPHVEKQN